MKIKKLGKKNIILLSVILILLLLAGGTLAFFGWSSKDENKDRIVDVTVSSGTGNCSKLHDNTKLLIPVSSKERGRVITISTKQTMAKNAVITWTLTVNKLNTEENNANGLKDESFKYELINKTTGVSYGSGNFANITDEYNTITFNTSKETLDYNVDYEFVLYLWIDGIRFKNNYLDITNQNFDIDIVCNIIGTENKIESPNYLFKHISNLYNQNDTVTNGNAAAGYKTYNIDTNNKLIEDIDSNIRYYGLSPDNYIYFNCDIYPETNCERWRIVGLFEDKVKIMKTSPIGIFSIDYDPNSQKITNEYNNNWEDTALKKLLNSEYLNNENALYYNKTDSGSEEVEVKFKSEKTGIKDSTRDLIAETTYYLGGIGNVDLFAHEVYNAEKGYSVSNLANSTSWSGKIGLPSSSDYAYAVDLKECQTYITEYNSDSCNNNWIKNMFSNNSNMKNFFITPSTGYGAVISVKPTGDAGTINLVEKNNVYPVLYIKPDVVIESSGNGTYDQPYKIST